MSASSNLSFHCVDESHSVIHGRPFPLKGEFAANLFVHFEPEDHSKRHNVKHGDRKDPNEQYKEDVANGIGGHEVESGLPPYLLPGSPEVANYIERNPNSEAAKIAKAKGSKTGTTIAHLYAASGDLELLKKALDEKSELLTWEDLNGWTPLHEGARSGNVEVVQYLLSKGANINHPITKEGQRSVLAVAHEIHGRDHPISKFIESVGGVLLGPEL
jgi:prolyl 4-hydroxylase